MGGFGSTGFGSAPRTWSRAIVLSTQSPQSRGMSPLRLLRPLRSDARRRAGRLDPVPGRRRSFTPVVSGPTARWGMAECRTANTDRLGSVPIRRCPAVFRLSGNCQRNYLWTPVVEALWAGKYFLSRHCNRLAYASQREDRYDRALRRANNIRVRLGGEPGTASAFPGRPKGMHHQTYKRLQSAVLNAEILAEERLATLWLGCN